MAEKYNPRGKHKIDAHVNASIYCQFSKSTSKSAAFEPSVASPLNQMQYNLNANQFHQQALLVLKDFLLCSGVQESRGIADMLEITGPLTFSFREFKGFTTCAANTSHTLL